MHKHTRGTRFKRSCVNKTHEIRPVRVALVRPQSRRAGARGRRTGKGCSCQGVPTQTIQRSLPLALQQRITTTTTRFGRKKNTKPRPTGFPTNKRRSPKLLSRENVGEQREYSAHTLRACSGGSRCDRLRQHRRPSAAPLPPPLSGRPHAPRVPAAAQSARILAACNKRKMVSRRGAQTFLRI